MAETQQPAVSDGADGSLDRLEVALERIASSLASRPPLASNDDPAKSQEGEQRLDAVIDHVRAVLDRKSGQ